MIYVSKTGRANAQKTGNSTNHFLSLDTSVHSYALLNILFPFFCVLIYFFTSFYEVIYQEKFIVHNW